MEFLKIYEELDRLYEQTNKVSVADLVEMSTIVIVPDVKDFTHRDAEIVAQRFNYDEEDTFLEDLIDPDPEFVEKWKEEDEEVRATLKNISNRTMTAAEKALLKSSNPNEIFVDKRTVDMVINKILNSGTKFALLDGLHKKNLKFLYDLGVVEKDENREYVRDDSPDSKMMKVVTAVLRQLSAKEYSYSVLSRNKYHNGNVLNLFITNIHVNIPGVLENKDLSMYIKIDATEAGLVTAVSFHNGSGKEYHPYGSPESIKKIEDALNKASEDSEDEDKDSKDKDSKDKDSKDSKTSEDSKDKDSKESKDEESKKSEETSDDISNEKPETTSNSEGESKDPDPKEIPTNEEEPNTKSSEEEERLRRKERYLRKFVNNRSKMNRRK